MGATTLRPHDLYYFRNSHVIGHFLLWNI